MNLRLTVIGSGLAGSEAAWQAAERGVQVVLYEMRPVLATPAHKTGDCAELVCSNSLGSNKEPSAPFLLKEELRQLDSLVIRCADKHSVPAGAALAVDREKFSQEITSAIVNHPNIELKREEAIDIPADGPVIIATGPLTSPSLSKRISELIGGQDYLYFYDALSPIIDANTIDYNKIFFASRYDQENGDYLNCPMSKEQYSKFVRALLEGETVAFKSFEKPVYFEGCLPIEVLAERGEKTLSFGPLKPVGLNHPDTNERFHAVVQLRRENAEGTAFNMVGFQTKLTYPEQKRIIAMVPGLEHAEIFRYGAIHRNTYINAPKILSSGLSLVNNPRVFFAGQIVGVEGYVESCAIGLMASLSAQKLMQGKNFIAPPPVTAIGSLMKYVTENKKSKYQPMNINFGLLPGLETQIRDKKLRNAAFVKRGLEAQSEWMKSCQEL